MYKKIKKIAKSKKISINQIELTLGIAQGSLCKWNEVKPSYDKVLGVAKILGVSVEELVSTESKED